MSIRVETNELCHLGCGKLAQFKNKSGKFTCESSSNACPEVKRNNREKLLKLYENGRDAKDIAANMSAESKEKMAWAKGLKKEFDDRVARPSLVGVRFGASLHGHSKETKELLSKHRISVLENSPNVKWYEISNGIKVQGLWEVNVGEKLISHGYDVSRTRILYDGHRRYTPDFRLSENLYVEVKGWLSDRDKAKYSKVLLEHPNIKIFLIRDECNKHNYSRFISGEIKLDECEDLRQLLGC